ncbi:hypothetical protein [Sulfurimonas sp. CS5]|uniref:hypothetical protein n=1 Tax=Sulfurimonas sp. CS5 TaxID=3391145 RepID=UPI0039E9A8D6
MANLKGGSFEKQVKDIFHRLSAFGEKRFGKDSHQTHSSAISKKRSEYASSFSSFITNKGLEGKLNTHMTNEYIKEYLELRTVDLAYSSTINYYRGFSSFIEGLKESNVSIEFDKKIIDDLVKDFKVNNIKPDFQTNRAIDNPEKIIESISNTHYSLSLVAQVQYECGLRVREAYAVVGHIEKYFKEDSQTLEGILGKGNHIYNSKNISYSLATAIEANTEKLPTQTTYSNVLSEYGVKSHDFRYTYAKNLYEKKTTEGENYKEVLKDVSKELNHTREQMTRFYLARA